MAGINVEVIAVAAQSHRRPEHAGPFDFRLSEEAERRLIDRIGTDRAGPVRVDRLVQRRVADRVVTKLHLLRSPRGVR